MTSLAFEDNQKAHILLKGVVIETPTLYSPSLSKVTGAQVFLKLENLRTLLFMHAVTKLNSCP